jgi:type IV pilus assembly protein PilM
MADENSFCIDLNERHIRMGQARLSGNAIQLQALGFENAYPQYYVSDTKISIDKQAEIIARLHSNLKIRTKNAHVVIPDAYSYSRVVEMPRLKEKELIAAIRYQADEFIPMDIDDTNLDLEVLKDDEKNNKMLIFIVASPKKIVERVQETLEVANLVPDTLENELSAAARLASVFFKRQANEQPGTTILINFGYSSTSLYLYDSTTSILLLSRTFKIGFGLFVKDLIANFNWDENKAMEALRNLGLGANSSVNLDPIISPIIKEVAKEIDRFMLISRDKYGLATNKVFIYNYDTWINAFPAKLQETLSLPVTSLKLEGHIVGNTIQQSFSSSLSSFVSVIAGNIT